MKPAPITDEFSSWDAFITRAADRSAAVWDDRKADMPQSESRLDRGTETFAEAVHLARFGWKEGRDKLTEAMVQVAPQREIHRVIHRDVAGEYPLVHFAVAGDPMAMALPRNVALAGSPVVRIDYASNVPARVDARCVINRGAALLSIIDRLEQRGFSTELRIIMSSEPAKYESTSPNYNLSIVYKRAGDALDIDRAAFALINPAVQRRLKFALQEQHARLERGYTNSYGMVVRKPLDQDAIYIPHADDEDYYPDQARSRMEAIFESHLG